MRLAWVLLAVGALLLPLSQPGAGAGPSKPDGHRDHVHKASSTAGSPKPSGHESAEGLRLAQTKGESVDPGPGCKSGAVVRNYKVAAIDVDISINRFLDHDPQGRMYVLEKELPRVRREEAQNAAAREASASGLEPAVTVGLQGDAIQPLTLRVNQGECLRIRLRNAMKTQPASLHLHGASLRVRGAGPAIANNPAATARRGQSVTYEWMVDRAEPEGTHYFHSHGDLREQTSHGLFGAVIVEPAGSKWLDPLDPKGERPLESGWAAIIQTGKKGGSFREFALYYHEIGHENYRLLGKEGEFVPLVDTLTNSYRPGARAINYRSEPFSNRLELQNAMMGKFDEAVAYSSYSFGDPATPIGRSYLGDATRQRVIHGGSEVAHVHHVHGGSIRWRRQPGAEPPGASGLQKHPPLLPKVSERTDSQTIEPSESFDVQNECGAGGCQQSPGDFLIHCHVAHHYFAGMWGLWRVYNTLQDGPASTDGLPPLAELPDARAKQLAAVDSTGLVGKTIEWSGNKLVVDKPGLATVVEAQLPPAGRAKGYDASVLDWTKEGELYLNEPDATQAWPGYRPTTPGRRRPFQFDPATGKLAYPFLRPQLGKRPPFPPDHSPAPFLDPVMSGPGRTEPPPPGSNGPASVCPTGAQVKPFQLQAITLPIALNQKTKLVDPNGEIFVLKDQEDAIRANPALRAPLTIRANAAQDCVDILLRSELEDSPENNGFAKVNVHIHFVQFDVQASDGVIAGYNYEQSVRPFAIEGEKLATTTPAGSTSIALTSAERFQPGVLVGIGMDQGETFEAGKVKAVADRSLILESPLQHQHASGEYVSTEFIRSRWYPDVQFGTAYFHDHVNAVSSWKHGLFGALISEPPGSSYHDPHSGSEVRSGAIADIRTVGKVSADVKGSFREMVLFIQDDNPITQTGADTGGSFNLRVSPIADGSADPGNLFSSKLQGDPETPLVEAFLGDPIVFRTLAAGSNEVTTFHIDGHWFRVEPFSKTSPPTGTVHLGISERYDLMVPRAGGPQERSGDYLYYSGRASKFKAGNWGIVRVRDAKDPSTLKKLPGRSPAQTPASSVCPTSAPTKRFDVAATHSGKGLRYVLSSAAGAKSPGAPLVLHVNVGDCIKVDLNNKTDGKVSFHADMLAFDPADSAGVNAGVNPDQLVEVGGKRTYTYYADPQVGETTALIRDWGNVLKNPKLGLYGAIVVSPAGATFRTPATGKSIPGGAGWAVDVIPRKGRPYRDLSLFMQDEDVAIGSHRMPYTRDVKGNATINYSSEPIAKRLADNPDPALAFSTKAHGVPATPLLEAVAGDRVKVHVLAPYSEQAQVFSIEGHRWAFEPGRAGSNELSSVAIGGLEAITLDIQSAGGKEKSAGDYVYGNHRAPFTEAGMWGIFRVHAAGRQGKLEALPGCDESEVNGCESKVSPITLVTIAAGAGVLFLIFARIRRIGRNLAPNGT
ncbi:MAG: multicopper oxidase domain-containing protein [Actinomycetota bacterium]